MCAIAGLLSRQPLPALATSLARLSGMQAHRGPDGAGFLTWSDTDGVSTGLEPHSVRPGRLALVHRRLSIVDLSPSGHQPMADGSGRRWLSFNGEIYNHPELRAGLEAAGHRFTSTSDTEVLLAVLARDGVAGLARLVGMYAFAYVDLDARTMLLARDPFGIKPLHYVLRDGMLAFASELKPLLAIGAARPMPDRAALFRYLRHAVTNYAGSTVLADVAELEPGTALEVSLDRPEAPRFTRFWKMPLPRAPRRLSFAEAVAETRALLGESVTLHMRADVPCAAALSGGVDSSGIVALMRERLPAGAPLEVFTYVADDDRLDELRWARIVADATGARITEVRLDPARLAGELDALILAQEQPFTTTSMWAQAHVYRAAHAAGFKVVLDGQGADELFAGYAVFRAARLEGLIRRGRLNEARALVAGRGRAGATALLQAAGGLLPEGARGMARRAVGRPVVPAWLDARWFGRAAVEHRPSLPEAHSPLAAALADAATGSSLPMLLRYADRNAMAVSVENRVPFLTPALAEHAAGLPDEALIAPDGTPKRVLREALRGLVPDAVLDRRDKIGFETPEARWFKTEPSLARMAAETARMPLPPCFSPAAASELAALGEGRIALAPHHWRIINVVRWASLLGIDLSGQPDSDTSRGHAATVAAGSDGVR